MIRYLLVFLFLFNCKVSEPKLSKPEVKISMQNGCYGYKGKDWDSCIIKLVKEFQDIYNAPVVSEIVSENRVSEDNVSITTKYCVKSICFEETREEYDPTFLSVVKKNIIIFSGGVLTGSLLFLKSGLILIF